MTQQPAMRSALRLFLAVAAMLVAGYAVGQAELGSVSLATQEDLLALVHATFGDARTAAADSLAEPNGMNGIQWSRTTATAPVNASALDWLLLVLAFCALLGLVSWRRMQQGKPG